MGLDCQADKHPFSAHPKPQLQHSWQYSTSCLVLVSWHLYRLVMSGVVPPNQVPLGPHYSHFYLLHTAAVDHLIMLDPATDRASQAGSCSFYSYTSNQAIFCLWKWNFITLKCSVSTSCFHWLVFLFVFCRLRIFYIFKLAYLLCFSVLLCVDINKGIDSQNGLHTVIRQHHSISPLLHFSEGNSPQ